ncbi:MAG: GNAT family N-acetyltransferase, partial [Pseudomonadota bacterium]
MTLARCTVPPAGAAAEAAARHRAVLPVLETARLRLRAPAAEDFPLWLRIGTEPGCEWIGGPIDPEEAWYDFCGYVACMLLHGHGPFVIERKADGTALGFVFLGYEWEDVETELGWFLAVEPRNTQRPKSVPTLPQQRPGVNGPPCHRARSVVKNAEKATKSD